MMKKNLKCQWAWVSLAVSLQVTAAGDDSVLQHVEAGKAAFDQSQWSVAAEHFDAAIQGIETVYGKDAAKARELFAAEKEKPYRGENYERVMAFYYRGLLDFVNADYENARASFESALLQDSLSIHGSFAQDFATMEFLSGWASRCAGSEQLAAASFERAVRLNPQLASPDVNQRTVVIGEAGHGPVKYSRQESGSLLQYARHPSDGQDYFLHVGNDQVISPTESLYYQAISRGPRAADAIATGKLSVSQNALAASDFFGSASELFLTNLGGGGGAGLVVGLAVGSVALAGSAVTGAIFNNIDAAADTRQWRNIPGTFFLATSTESISTLKLTIKLQPLGFETAGAARVQTLTSTPICQVARISVSPGSLNEYAELQAVLSARQYPLMK